MRFSDCEMRPGKVLEVIDNYGTIKASCAGLFSEEDDTANLPPVYQAPFIKSSRHYYAAPQKDDLIWVIANWDNPQELFYCFRDDMNDNSSELDNGPKDIEICMKRTDPDDRTKTTFEVSYDSDNGYNISNGGDSASKINVDNTENHDIHLDHSSGIGIHVEKNKINLGTKGGSKYKAVCGEPLYDILKTIMGVLDAISNGCTMPHAAPIKASMAAKLMELHSTLNKEKMLSEKVTLDK